MKQINYIYKNCPIPGGGYVTGFTFHPKEQNILYARTDIGGIYRFDFEKNLWFSLSDHVKSITPAEVLPLALAIDEDDSNMLFSACGDSTCGYLAVSQNRGNSFELFEVPATINGNSPGRSTGERLVVTKNNVFFGSQSEGLLVADRENYNWNKIDVKTANGLAEKNITFIDVSVDEQRIIVGTDGSANMKSDTERGETLYISVDGGATFKNLPTPKSYADERISFTGFVPMRCAIDGEILYVSFNLSVNRGKRLHCYATDTDPAFDGRLISYRLDKSGNAIEVTDLTPKIDLNDKNPNRKFGNAIYSIAIVDEMMFISTVSGAFEDTIFASLDKGKTFKKILQGTKIGKVEVDVPYMKSQYNGNTTVIHWITDLKINPFDKNHAVVTTGTGVFMTNNLTDCEKGSEVVWKSMSWGIEETVHLNVYSPPSGDVRVIDIVGDLGGFAFTDLDKPCENSFADADGNRYITCLNGDFAEENPDIVVATPRGNWQGLTKGGLILSQDQCKTWTLLPKPYHLGNEISECFTEIEKPNVDSGWTAISADGKSTLWAVAKQMRFQANLVIRTDNHGESWEFANFKTKDNIDLSKLYVRLYSDRVNSNRFYAFSSENRIFSSEDRGKNFTEINVPSEILSDGYGQRGWSQVTVEPQSEGVIWFATGKKGLWRIENKNGKTNFTKVIDSDIFCVGIGKNAGYSAYKTIFITGIIDGKYGFYRSTDYGDTWDRINNDSQMFGRMSAIAGDPREFGRVYLATGSRGLIHGIEEY